MVAAAVAWVRAARPDLTADQVAQAVRLSAVDHDEPGWQGDTGFGVLNVGRGAHARRVAARSRRAERRHRLGRRARVRPARPAVLQGRQDAPAGRHDRRLRGSRRRLPDPAARALTRADQRESRPHRRRRPARLLAQGEVAQREGRWSGRRAAASGPSGSRCATARAARACTTSRSAYSATCATSTPPTRCAWAEQPPAPTAARRGRRCPRAPSGVGTSRVVAQVPLGVERRHAARCRRR